MPLYSETGIKKTGIVTLILLLMFYCANLLFTSNSSAQVDVPLNAAFQNTESYGLGGVSVALTSNIGTKLKERQATPANLYTSTLDIADSLGNEISINKELIKKNMFFVQDYLNLLKTNVVEMLDNSSNRNTTLENFTTQLESRYKDGNENLTELSTQLSAMQSKMNNTQTQIESLKVKINNDFKAFDAVSTNENVDQYFILRNEYTYARTHVIFINQFIKQYNFLNNYNKVLLDTIINNKKALSSGGFVVIPDSGSELLRKLNLIYDESEFKTSTASQE